jgi:hypothetical protein
MNLSSIREVTPFEALFEKLRELHSEQFEKKRELSSYRFMLTREDEKTLAFAGNDLPPDLQMKVLLEGPRAVFQQIYGVSVEWDAPETGVRELTF